MEWAECGWMNTPVLRLWETQVLKSVGARERSTTAVSVARGAAGWRLDEDKKWDHSLDIEGFEC